MAASVREISATSKDLAGTMGEVNASASHAAELATKGRVRDWEEAFAKGDAKATGIEQVLKLIVNVVQRRRSENGVKGILT